MKKVLFFVALFFFASGCATTPTKVLWSKPDGNVNDKEYRQEYAKDVYECTQESTTQWQGGGTGLMGVVMIASAKKQADDRAKSLFIMCMEARGWAAHFVKGNE